MWSARSARPAPRGAPSSSPRNSSTGPHPTVLGSIGVSGSWFFAELVRWPRLTPTTLVPYSTHSAQWISGQCGTLVKLREPDGGRLRACAGERKASGVRCVPLLVETFGGLSPRASSHSVRRRSGVGRKIQVEQADGVRTASEYRTTRRPAWSARTWMAFVTQRLSVASQLSMAQEAAEALTTLHGEQLCSRVHTVSLRSSAPVRLVRHAQAISAPSCSFSTFPSCSRKIVPSSSTLAPPCPLQGSSCLPVPHR